MCRTRILFFDTTDVAGVLEHTPENSVIGTATPTNWVKKKCHYKVMLFTHIYTTVKRSNTHHIRLCMHVFVYSNVLVIVVHEFHAFFFLFSFRKLGIVWNASMVRSGKRYRLRIAPHSKPFRFRWRQTSTHIVIAWLYFGIKTFYDFNISILTEFFFFGVLVISFERSLCHYTAID